jgi:ABC-2 type transport system permease protein
MKQIFYIIQREVVTSVRKKSFLLFSVLSPLVFLLPFIFIMFKSSAPAKNPNIALVDESHIFSGMPAMKINNATLTPVSDDLEELKTKLTTSDSPRFNAIITIPANVLTDGASLSPIKYYTTSAEEINSSTTHEIAGRLNSIILEQRLRNRFNMTDSAADYASTRKLYPIVLETKKSNTSRLASMLAYTIGMLMYLMFIIFNNSLLRGVTEEKTNRIVEVFSMVVKPFNLMIGKILGVGCIALMQLVIWVTLSVIYMKLINYTGVHFFHVATTDNTTFSLSYILDNYQSLPIRKMLIFTPIFFILGFLVNGAITTVVGATASVKGNSSLSIVSNLINIGSIYIAMFSAGYPDNAIAKASLYIPFFSPIVLPALLPYNLPPLTIAISLTILIVSFFALVALAGRIYRISIISYGSKINLKDMMAMIVSKNL